MNKRIKAKKFIKMGERYFYKKYLYVKAIIHFTRAIVKDEHCENDEEILRKISKSYLYLSDNYDANRDYNLSQALVYIDKSLRVSSGFLKSLEQKFEYYKRFEIILS